MPLPARQLRVALVGVGSAATRAHLPALAASETEGALRLVGICDHDRERRQAVVAGHPGARGFADNDEMLEAVAPDLLVIATPPSAHLAEMAAAAGRGIQVLCEKPLGLSGDDVACLRRIAAAHPGLALATVHQYRHARPWAWLARAAAGALRDGEELELTVSVERPGTDPLSAGGWRTDPEHEGGILGDHAVHYLALLHLLDPGCVVTGCHSQGPGGREVASVEARIGAAGRARVDVSYAGARRRNLISLARPSQCLEMAWEDGTLRVRHTRTGRSSERRVQSLSDRVVVNALYQPMYAELVERIDEPAWRAAATAHTVGVAQLLADSLRLARVPAAL